MKKTNFKKVMAAGLVLSMTAAVVGCGNGGNSSSGSGKNGKNSTTTDPSVAKENVYSYEKLGIDFSAYDSYDILSTSVVDGRLYMAVQTYIWSDDGSDAGTYVYSMNADGSDVQQIKLALPEVDSASVGELDSYANQTGSDAVVYSNVVEYTAATEVAVESNDITTDILTDGISSDDILIDDGIDLLDPDDYYYSDDSYFYENTSLGSINILDNKCFAGYADHYYDGYVGDEYVSNDESLICYWDENGNILWQKNLVDLTGYTYCYINEICSLDDGSFLAVLSGDDTVAYVFDKDGNTVINKSSSDLPYIANILNIFNGDDGKFVVSYYDPDNNYETSIAYADAATLKITENIELPEYLETNGFNALAKGVDSDFVFTTDTGVAKFNAGDTDITYFMNYINSDLEGYSINNVSMIDSEHFIGSYYDPDTYDTVVALFTYVDPSTIPDKQVITLAVYYMNSDVRFKVVEFNKSNDEYRIVMNSYDQYATDDDYLAGVTKLNNEIIAGNCPDILMVYPQVMDFTSYANKGMLADFDELIAGDDELKNNQYLTNVFDAFAINGKHYVGVYNFTFNSFLGNSSYFGDKTSWTVSDFAELVKSLPSDSCLLSSLNCDGFLDYIMTYDGAEFIDLSTGKCEFNSDDFITLLEYAASLPSADETDYTEDYYMDYYDQYRSGKTLMMNSYLYDLSWYNENIYECFNGEATLIGFPSRTGDCACISTEDMPIVIFNNGNVDGAWSFAREFFTEDYQNSMEYEIPVLESAFDAWAQKGTERQYWVDENGEKQYYDTTYWIDDVEYTVPVMTQDEVDTLKAQIKSCTKSQYYNEEVLSIVEEEASACFSGQKSAKEVADIIQSRVQLYINENQ